MTLLAALARHYDAIPGIAPPGWSQIRVARCIVLARDGRAVGISDMREHRDGRLRVREFLVPWPDEVAKRTSSIVPNLLVDKSAYVLGCSAGHSRRAAQEHEAFVSRHLNVFADATDAGLLALLAFLRAWRPQKLASLPGFVPDVLDSHIMFRIEGDSCLLHERAAVRVLLAAVEQERISADEGYCLIDGSHGPVARLHRPIRGIDGALSSGAALVSCNEPAFASYGHKQGKVAPCGEAAAFRYAAALNHLLQRQGLNRVRETVGGMTIVAWTQTAEGRANDDCDRLVVDWLNGAIDDDAARMFPLAEAPGGMGSRNPWHLVKSGFDRQARVGVVGLSPNGSRILARVWVEDRLDSLMDNLANHCLDCTILPRPAGWGVMPSLARLLQNTIAGHRDPANVPAGLAGGRAGSLPARKPYPRPLLPVVLMRIRAGGNLAAGWHAAVIRGVLARDHRLGILPDPVPERLDTGCGDPGYLLGRLFSLYELAERGALGQFRTTIRHTRLCSAASMPARVFPGLAQSGAARLVRLHRLDPDLAVSLEREIARVHTALEDGFPPRLSFHAQCRFVLGYYHQAHGMQPGTPSFWAEPDMAEAGSGLAEVKP